MKGEQHLTNPEDFARVHGQGKWLGDGVVGVKSCPTGLKVTRYGFTVSKRVGNAVVRNRVKRRLREIVRKTSLRPGSDIIVSAKPRSAQADFKTLKTAVLNLLVRAGLLARNDKEDCSGGD